ncbi:carbohydrate ABC transporter permease [Cohnella nanjingensis]|uniref:Carbohydrate ABC transporter permease n=1 Tax=Cohnella nanjingensis TaxID=1387779 RepID=A0A7X0VIG9_9BACL|nr:carbohydrate ABC transporter permease [Cohnella nanjingensis]MBB6675187.1 carbohydrate ABC transporter permease [Cohnella nanjingensis]
MQTRAALQKTWIYAVLAVSFCFFFFPFLLLLFNALKTNAQIIDSPSSLPTSLRFGNFKAAIEEMGYFRSLWNTFFITSASVVLILLFSGMTAYFFVRNKTRLNDSFFFMMVSSMVIPFQSIMIPIVSIYGRKLGWIHDQPQSTLIFMYIGFGVPLAVFIYHGFIKSVPLELEEAALMDGCNRWKTYFKIVLPILKPTSVTIGILDVLWIWNDFLLPTLVLQNAGKHQLTLPLAIQVFNSTYSTNYEKFLPAVLLIVLPILIVYLFAQRFIIQGVTQGSIK